MISLPQIQFACDLCNKRVEVEIERSYIAAAKDFYFDHDEWMEDHGWRQLEGYEIRCPEHEENDD